MRRNLITGILACLLIASLQVSCVNEAATEEPVPAVKGEKLRLRLTMEAPVTKAEVAPVWEEVTGGDVKGDSLSLGLERLVERMDAEPETKGEALRSSLPSDLWFNIYDVTGDEYYYDCIYRENDEWVTDNEYFINPAHEYEIFVSSFDSELSYSTISITPDTEFDSCPDGDADYNAFTCDDIVGYDDHLSGGTSAYDITMRHIYAAVLLQFNGDGPTGAVIESVSLTNLKACGDLLISSDEVSWELEDDLETFSFDVDHTITNGTAYSFGDLGPVYVPAGCTTSSSRLVVTLSYLGQTFTLSRSLAGESWSNGYKYTYRLAFSGFVDSDNYELSISPADADVNVGSDATFTASLNFRYAEADHSVPSGVSVNSWTAATTSVAAKQSSSSYSAGSTSAVFRGAAAGSSDITCSVTYMGNTYQATAHMSVTDNITYQHRLTIAPDAQGITIGESCSYVATYHTDRYINGVLDTTDYDTADVSSSATWDFNGASVGSYVTNNGGGTFTGKQARNNITVRASYEGLSVTARLDVLADYRVVVTPGSASISVGDTQAYTARFQRKTSVSGSWSNYSSGISNWVWNSSDSAVASVVRNTNSSTSTATATGLKSGSTYITAGCTFGGNTYISGSTDNLLTVISGYRVVVTPASASIDVEDTQGYSAKLQTNGSGSWADVSSGVSSWSWSSSSTAVASVVRKTKGQTSTATATGRRAGTTYITASCIYGGNNYTSGSTDNQLTVTSEQSTSYYLEITPATATIAQEETQNFKAYLHTVTREYQWDGADFSWVQVSDVKGSEVTNTCGWGSEDYSIAYMTSTAGQFKGGNAGTTEISAELELDEYTSVASSPNATLTVTAKSRQTVRTLIVTEAGSSDSSDHTSGNFGPFNLEVGDIMAFDAWVWSYQMYYYWNGSAYSWKIDDSTYTRGSNYRYTSGNTWYSGDTDVVNFSTYRINALGAGSTTIHAEYYYSAWGTLVSNEVTVNVVGGISVTPGGNENNNEGNDY